LPEGAEVQLWVVEGDDLDDEDRAALHDAIREGIIREGIEDAKAGRTVDADEWAAELRSRL
jgi:predicted transcriptional regulator